MTQAEWAQRAPEAGPRSRETLGKRLEALRAEAEGAPDDVLLLRVEAPVACPEAFLERFPEGDAVFWQPPDGRYFAGIGVAHAVSGEGPNRFQQIRKGGADLWARVRALAAPGYASSAAPRLFGGFSFAEAGATEEPWSALGPARFVLPRVSYEGDREHACLTLALERAELARGLSCPSVELFQRAYEVLAGRPSAAPSRPAQPLEELEPSAGAFEDRVVQLIRAIRAGQFEKVATARRIELTCRSAIDTMATLIALTDRAPECSRFLFRTSGVGFIGATPERLLRKRGLELETEALAGTIDATTERPEHRLQGSSKELEEHSLVVSAIQRALAPLCARIEAPERPGVRNLKHILHLCTPIQARLERELHVLDLIERLHPTPAVGGVPTRAATEWIVQHEGFDRGWYSGAVGWFDARGDGEFNVALRSGLIRNDRAWLYAGAGIVRESFAPAELAETTLKLSALRNSLRTRA